MEEEGGKLPDKKPLVFSIMRATLSSKWKRKIWRKLSQQHRLARPRMLSQSPWANQSFRRKPQGGEIRTWQEILPLSKQEAS